MQVESIPSRYHTSKKKCCAAKGMRKMKPSYVTKKTPQVGNSNYYLTGMPPEMRKRTEVGT